MRSQVTKESANARSESLPHHCHCTKLADLECNDTCILLEIQEIK